MKSHIHSASLVILGLALGTAISALAANAPTRPGAPAAKPAPAAPAKPAPAGQTKLSPVPPPPPASARDFETVEYKFYVLSNMDAATDNHERDLNALGAQGWRVVSPIYAGGILNSYLMMRIHPNK